MNSNILVQVGMIFGIYLMGEGIATLLPIAIPGNILGMLLMFLSLVLKWVKLQQVETVGRFLIKYMAFLFIPASVSIMESFKLIKDDWFKIMLICILTTFITFAATGLTAKYVISVQERIRAHK